jgi:hypothetical protein
MGQTVNGLATLLPGLRADFATTYKKNYMGIEKQLAPIMQLGVPSDKLEEFYAYFKSAPHPARLDMGKPIESQAFDSVGYSAINYDFALRCEWFKNQREDDQIKSLTDRVRDGGKNFALLPERILFQLLQATTDNNLLPYIPLAPDGVGLYSATDGAGANRFGVSGGNVMSSSGVATSEEIRIDIFKALTRFKYFQDAAGQPLWQPSLVDNEGITILASITNEKVFREAFKQARTLQVTTPPATGAFAQVSNIVLESGLKITVITTARITTNYWYIFLDGAPQKAVAQQMRQGIQEWVATMENSDECRKHKKEAMQWDCRQGYVINLPYQTIEVAP